MKPKKPKDLNAALERGFCTHPSCRDIIDPGQGIQWLDEQGVWHRYCSTHYSDKVRDRVMEGPRAGDDVGRGPRAGS